MLLCLRGGHAVVGGGVGGDFNHVQHCKYFLYNLTDVTALEWQVDWMAVKVHEEYVGLHNNLPIREHLVEWRRSFCELSHRTPW